MLTNYASNAKMKRKISKEVLAFEESYRFLSKKAFQSKHFVFLLHMFLNTGTVDIFLQRSDKSVKLEEKMEVIDRELNSLLNELIEENITGKITRKHIQELCIPISTILQLDENRRQKKKKFFWKYLLIFGLGILFLLLVINQSSTQFQSTVKFHGLAILRIALVKVLPIWNWTELYYSRCLIKNPYFEDQELRIDDCNLCETLEDIEKFSNVSQASVIEEFIKRERPFVVSDGMKDWPIMNTNHFWFDNITELYVHQERYRACNLNTNVGVSEISSGDLSKVLKKLYNPHTTQWFLHWENCQKDGAKATRQFYKRPYFITNSLDFTGSNWILMSSDFRGRVYKILPVRDSLSMLYQIRGSNQIRLSPKEICRAHCPEIPFTLYEGEILVVTNLLWSLEYIPGENGDNLAIISEVSWPLLE